MRTKQSKKVSSIFRVEQQATNTLLFDQLQQQFTQWRSSKSKNDRVPHALRQAVVSAIDNGLPTSKLELLRLSHTQLKRWRAQKTVSSKTTPHFVAVEPIDNTAAMARLPMTASCELNLHYPHGLRVDIRLSDVTSAAQLLKTLY